MIEIGVEQAKKSFGELIDRVEAGESIVITRWGRPAALLEPIRRRPRVLGSLRERIEVSNEFDEALPDEVVEQFEGRRLDS